MMRLTLWVIGRAMFRGEFLDQAEQVGEALEICAGVKRADLRGRCEAFAKR